MFKWMRKALLIILAAYLAVSAGSSPTNACTSFAEYSNKVLFGNNFDYPDTPIRLNYFDENGLKVFYGEFKDGENFYMFCAMSNKGLFVPTQIQYPGLPAKEKLEENEIVIGALPSIILPFDRISQVRELLDKKKLAPMQFPIHIMASDKYGDSVICEVGKEKNALVDIQDEFQVMTNFKNSDFTGKPNSEILGAGADRYITACDYIKANLDDFDFEDGWNVLKKTVQTNPACLTLMSSIFNPDENAVFFALKQNFDRVWKVSLEKGTIETYKGFDKGYTLPIPKDGILSSALADGSFALDAMKATPETGLKIKNPLYIVLIASLVLFLPSLFLLKGKKVKKKK